MELETLFGLPAHPLLVHGAVVLVPLAALATLVVAVAPRLRRHYAPLALALSVAALGAVGLSQGSGEALEESIPRTELLRDHTRIGESVMPWMVGLVVVAALVTLAGLLLRRFPRIPNRALSIALPVLALVVAAGSLVSVVRVGHSGAKAAWDDVTVSGDDHD